VRSRQEAVFCAVCCGANAAFIVTAQLPCSDFWRRSVDRSEPGRLGPPLFLLCIDGDKHRAPMKGIMKTMNRNQNQKLVEECKKLLENGLLPFSIFMLGSALLIVIGVKLWL
jgi:hypothetical protein